MRRALRIVRFFPALALVLLLAQMVVQLHRLEVRLILARRGVQQAPCQVGIALLEILHLFRISASAGPFAFGGVPTPTDLGESIRTVRRMRGRGPATHPGLPAALTAFWSVSTLSRSSTFSDSTVVKRVSSCRAVRVASLSETRCVRGGWWGEGRPPWAVSARAALSRQPPCTYTSQ